MRSAFLIVLVLNWFLTGCMSTQSVDHPENGKLQTGDSVLVTTKDGNEYGMGASIYVLKKTILTISGKL